MNDYVAKLFTENKLLKTLHGDCRLANILAGNTCAPISLEEFELYLAYREVSLENLQFVVWFLDYQNRWSKLPKDLQASTPDPALFNNSSVHPRFSPQAATFDSSRFNSLTHKLTSAFRRQGPTSHIELQLTSSPTTTNTSHIRQFSNNDPSTPSTSSDPYSPTSPSLNAPLLQPLRSTSWAKSNGFPISPLPSTPGSPFFQTNPYSPGPSPWTLVSPSDQPFRDETIRIVATFMRTGGTKKELALEEEMRDQVLKNLAFTTHPNVFLPVYKQIYEQLEMSVQNFLTATSANVNLPKQLYWYAVGFVNVLLSFIMAALIITLVPCSKSPNFNPNVYARAWRLFAVPFSALGAMQFYSGYRGFCSQVYGRSAIQLKAWELEEPEEVGVKWRKKKMYKKVERSVHTASDLEMGEKTGGVLGSDKESSDFQTLSGPGTGTPHDPSLIAPFAFSNLSLHGEATMTSQDECCTEVDDAGGHHQMLASINESKNDLVRPDTRHDPKFILQAPTSTNPIQSTHEIALVKPKRRPRGDMGFSRPPVFGPEKVVMDSRIRRYHESVLTDMAWFGCYWTIAFTAIIMCLPCPKR